MGSNSGVKVIGYDFSEAQHGKDICDRKTATMKRHARRFVTETKTNILTAFDLKEAMESNVGVKGCRVSVVEMPQSGSQVDTNSRIPGISQIHNIRYEEGGMRYWKAYGVSKGEWLAGDDTLSVNIPKLNVLEAFICESCDTGTMVAISKCTDGKKKANEAAMKEHEVTASFDCSMEGCICTFESDAELQKYLDVGSHVRRLHRELRFDNVKRQYVDMVTDELSNTLFIADSKGALANQNVSNGSNVAMGWALKTQSVLRVFLKGLEHI